MGLDEWAKISEGLCKKCARAGENWLDGRIWESGKG